MFDIPDETVNLPPLSQSTMIGALAAARLPLWWRLTYRLLAARCIYCDTPGDLGEIDLCSGCLRPCLGVIGSTPLKTLYLITDPL